MFRPELQRLSQPDLFVVRPSGAGASLTELRASAAAGVAGLDLYRVVLPQNKSTSYEFVFGTDGKLTTRVYVDPYRGTVLGRTTADTDVFRWLQSFHHDLLAGEQGRRVNGVVAASLIMLCVSGLTLWLMTRARWAARLAPRWRVRPARRNWSLHVAGGFWAFPLLLLMSSTALYFAFHDPVAKVVYALTFTDAPPPVPRVKAVSGSSTVPLDALLARARSLEPAAALTMIRLPRTTGQLATVNYALPGDLSDLGANAIHFDPNTGEAMQVDRIRDMQLGRRIVAAFVPLHFGTFAGTASRVLWALLGCLPTILFATGLSMSWRRRSRRAMAEGTSSEEHRDESLLEVRR